MADDDEKTTVEVEDGAEAGEKKGGSNMLMLGGIGLGAVIIGVVLALFVLRPMMSGGGEDSATDTEQVERADKKEDSHGKKKEDSHAKKPKSSHGGEGAGEGSLVYAIQDIVVNPAGTAGSRFLSISFGFDLGSEALYSEFEGNEQRVRDALITILSSKTVSQLTDTKQKEIMRYQIKKRLSTLLETEELEAVYYTDFVLQ